MAEPIKLARRQPSLLRVAPEWADVCLTCGACASGCPITGIDGFDPRKAVRMAVLGLEQELIDSRFPWICTACGRCEYVCPMGVNLLKLFRKARSLRERDKVPGPIHKGVVMDLERGNNLGIPTTDFLFLLADVALILIPKFGFQMGYTVHVVLKICAMTCLAIGGLKFFVK